MPSVLLPYLGDGSPIYAQLAAVLFLIGMWRYVGLLKFHRSGSIADRAEAWQWERDYLIKGSIQALALGSFTFISLYEGNSSIAQLVGLGVPLASAITVVGRNYGSARMVAIFAAAFVIPIILGLVLRNDLPHVLLGLILVPFFLVVIATAAQLRDVLFSAVIGHNKARQLAQRFDRALNTMPHGLVMLNPEGRVVVANAEAAHLLRLSSPEAILGRSLHAILSRAVAGGLLDRNECRHAVMQLTRALREGRDRKLLVSLSNGRHFELSTREGRDDLGVITFEDVSPRVEAEEKIRFMARYDGLTGLANRAYFHEVVEHAIAAGDPDRLCALAVFDLDDFKSINDTLGHPVGDGLIWAVADRLARFAAGDVTVSRFGGDEFTIFFNRVESETDLRQRLDAIFAGLQGEIDVVGHALRIQVSAGAVASPAKHSEVDAMIVKADLALYKAKELGKNGWRLFESAMDEAFRTKQILKADLRSAVETRSLRVVYQPIVSLETMRISSCEALCRWDHPELGPISPSVFIPLAEEMGIVSEISTFMLAAAAHECTKWPEQVSVSVNLSAKDFRDADIVRKVKEALADSKLAPRRLEIEVTETALLDDKSSTREHIEQLKALGIRIALDDFGTGYSSLSYLHTLPLDKVKIDRSFLADVNRNPRSLELLKGIVNLSRPLGLAVTVEGVETFEQLKILALEVRPELVQGFLFGAPLSASGIETISNTVWPFAEDIDSACRAACG